MARVLAILLVTLLAAGLGGVGGREVYRLGVQAAQHERPAEATPVAPKKASNVRELKPIVTNLAASAGAWVRLEAAIVADLPDVEFERLAAEITGDTLAYLRTLTIADLGGVEALRNLRADLSERAAIRSDRRVLEFIIETLVVQ